MSDQFDERNYCPFHFKPLNECGCNTPMAPMTNDLKQRAIDAIDKLFGDTSVSVETTLDRMEELRSHIDINIQTLKDDIKAQEEE